MKKYTTITFLLLALILSSIQTFAFDGMKNKDVVNLLSLIRNNCLGDFIKASNDRFITDIAHEVLDGLPGKKETFTIKMAARDPIYPDQLIDDLELMISYNSYPPNVTCNTATKLKEKS